MQTASPLTALQQVGAGARLDGVERDELAELTFEAWRLTAPPC